MLASNIQHLASISAEMKECKNQLLARSIREQNHMSLSPSIEPGEGGRGQRILENA